jgi:putative DNA primase/helicase
LAYARRATSLARRTVYVATVNDKNYLTDQTGNRRWWTLTIKSINLEHGLDIKQVWAEAYILWKNGALTYLSQNVQAEINLSNLEYEKIDPLKEKVLTWYDWSNPVRKSLSATAVLEELGYKQPNQKDATQMGRILTEINKKEGRKSNGVKVHEVPCIILNRNNFNIVK